MQFSDGHIDTYVEVTEKYRSVFDKRTENSLWQAMIAGNGFGKIVGFTINSDWTHPQSNKLFKIKWCGGYTNLMHPGHLQLSTKKAIFHQLLRG